MTEQGYVHSKVELIVSTVIAFVFVNVAHDYKVIHAYAGKWFHNTV